MPKPRVLFALLLPWIALGQQQTPAAEADQVLRARVTEFLQYHVEGNFRKAYDIVADDTKEDYFNSGKAQIKGFTIDDVKLTDNNTKATVVATISKIVNVLGNEFPMQVNSRTTWKIENGKWVWYKDADARDPGTPMGLAAPAAPTNPVTATPKPVDNDPGAPPKELDDKAIAAAARSILQQVGVDKETITLASDKPSEEKVVFHNGLPGSVQVELSAPEVPGFTVKLEQATVRSGTNVPVTFRYQPGDAAERIDPIEVRLTTQPLNQVFVIHVNFAAAGAK